MKPRNWRHELQNQETKVNNALANCYHAYTQVMALRCELQFAKHKGIQDVKLIQHKLGIASQFQADSEAAYEKAKLRKLALEAEHKAEQDHVQTLFAGDFYKGGYTP